VADEIPIETHRAGSSGRISLVRAEWVIRIKAGQEAQVKFTVGSISALSKNRENRPHKNYPIK